MQIRTKILALGIACLLQGMVWSQEPPQGRSSPNVESLTDKKTIVDLMKQISELEDAMEESRLTLEKLRAETAVAVRDANFPQGKSEGLTGSVTSTPYTLAHAIQAYRASDVLSKLLAERIGANVAEGAKVPLLISTVENPLQDMALARSTQIELGETLKTYAPLLEEANQLIKGTWTGELEFADGILAAKSVASNLADLASFFKSDVELKTGDIDINDAAIVAQLSTAVKVKDKFTPYYLDGKVWLPKKDQVSDPGSVRALMRKVIETRSTAQLAAVKLEPLTTVKDGATDEQKTKAARATQIRDDLMALNSGVEELKKALAKVDETTKLSVMQRVDHIESMMKLLDNNKTQILHVRPVIAGGGTRTTKHVFNSGSLSFSGGIVLAYFLYDNAGNMADSATVYNHVGWQTMPDGGGSIPLP